jgi:hypothetical protein
VNTEKKFIRLFSCCIPVKGVLRSSLCDTHRGEIKLIPNALYQLIPFFDSLSKDDLINYYGEQNRQTVKEYIDYLIDNELAFYCAKDELECFPLMNISEFHIPFHITNAIIELEKTRARICRALWSRIGLGHGYFRSETG